MHDHHLHLYGFFAFFTFGFFGSLHCMGMCGPLSTLILHQKKKSLLPLGLYHLSRLIAYGLVGFLLFSLGTPLHGSLISPYLIWLVILPLLTYGFGFHFKPPALLLKFQTKILEQIKNIPLFLKPIFLGLLTPLLPCGLLYAAFAGSFNAPNSFAAIGWMMSFALGTLPLLFLSQWGWGWSMKKLSPQKISYGLRYLALITASVMIYFFFFGHH